MSLQLTLDDCPVQHPMSMSKFDAYLCVQIIVAHLSHQIPLLLFLYSSKKT